MTAGVTRCIDENDIGALFDHRLSKAEVDAIDSHVSACEACRDLLCGLARLYAASSPSRALVQTVALLDPRAATPAAAVDEANVRRLLALLSCESRVGTILCGKWRLDGVLGVGGMAEVYAATHQTNGRRAAIKMLRREWLSRPNVVFRFLREGYVANRLNHSGAVAILDDGTTENGIPFLVLELLDGHTIATHAKERLPIGNVLRMTSEILDVLSAAHDQGIVHRDIKPDNVFVTRAGPIKVLDFGIARMHDLAENQGPGRRHTQQGTTMGTPGYMPPEQARGRLDEIDARSDIWAVGATMFDLLAGRPVHDEASAEETLVAAMNEPAPKLATVAPHVPAEICELVDRALAFRREDRWQNAREMRAAIHDAVARLHGSPSRQRWASIAPGAMAVDARETPRSKSSSGRAVTALVAVLAIVTAGGFVARARMRPAHAAATVASEPAPVVTHEAKPTPNAPEAAPVQAAAPSTSLSSAAVQASAKAPTTAPRASSPKPGRRAPSRRPAATPEPSTVSAPPPPAPEAPPPPPAEPTHPLDRRD